MRHFLHTIFEIFPLVLMENKYSSYSYTGVFTSGLDDFRIAFWLAIRARKTDLSRPLCFALAPQEEICCCGKKSSLLSTLVRSRSLDICLVVVVVVVVVFGMFIALDSSRFLETGKKIFANIQPSWSSRLALTHILFQFLYSYDLGVWL